MSTTIAPLESREEFEKLATHLLTVIWEEPRIVRYERSGAREHGIDAYGFVAPLGRKLGVAQFAARNELTFARVERDLAKLDDGFPARPAVFLVVTSAAFDAWLQDAVRRLSWTRIVQGKCSVELVFWERIIDQVRDDHELLRRHYPGAG